MCSNASMKTEYAYQNEPPSKRKAQRIKRAKEYAKRIKNGETIADIARDEGVSRQRIHWLLGSIK